MKIVIWKIIKNIISYTLASIIAFLVVTGIFWFYDEVYTQIPKIEKSKIYGWPETTKITDRNGNILFKIFEENREYIPAYQISPHMFNAIISIEDETFWKHGGINILNIIRAAKNNIFTNNPLQGGSTIDQQLVRNLLLNNKKTIKRKLKERILTLRFHSYLKKELENNGKHPTKNDIKLKILELYLNYIPFGNNTFGIQTASKKYFNTNAKDLNILQSSILASIPKGTSIYNPYTNKDRLLGYIQIFNKEKEKISNTNQVEIFNNIKKLYIQNIKKKLKENELLKNIGWKKLLKQTVNSMESLIYYKGEKYTIQYKYGRKDIVLSKMVELKKISITQYKKAIIEGLSVTFYKEKNNIKAPHFIFFVLNKLNQSLGEDMIKQGGLTIKTSLDLEKQQEIEKSMQNNFSKLQKYGANNSANMTINTENGDIITYIGSRDFRDSEIGGENDLIQSKRQLGSILKPFFYAQAFDNLNIGPHTIITDTPIKIGQHIPRNYDNKFKGNIRVNKALPQSRNIPAIKIFYDLGGEKNAKNLFKQLGITSAKEEEVYGYNMVLGGVEMPLYELITAYRHLSNPHPAIINPILEIRDKHNQILYQKEVEQKKSIFTEKTINNIKAILTNPNNFEKRTKYRLKKYGITFAVKSGTSGIKTANGQDRSRDGILVGYNEKYITAFRAGNTNGTPMHKDAYGFFLSIDTLKAIHDMLKK